jgi:hypothetical protein
MRKQIPDMNLPVSLLLCNLLGMQVKFPYETNVISSFCIKMYLQCFSASK